MTTDSTPVTPGSPVTPSSPGFRPDSGRLVAGFLIIAFGVILLLARTAHPDWLDRSGWWPLFMIGLGAVHLATGGRLSAGFMWILLGGWGLLNEFGVWNYESSWPIVFVIIGVSITLGAFVKPSNVVTTEQRELRKGRGDLRLLGAFMVIGLIISSMHAGQRGFRDRDTDERNDSANILRRSAVMSQNRTVSYAEAFEGARIRALMGECDLDLTHAGIAEGTVPVVRVNVLMGQATLRVPEDWTVDNEVAPIMGNLSYQRRSMWAGPVQSSSKRIIVSGSVMMGELRITN
jgi:predicted membrane protein